MRLARRRHHLIVPIAVALIASVAGQAPAFAAPPSWTVPTPKDVPGVKVVDAQPPAPTRTLSPAGARPTRAAWPAASTATADLTVGRSSAAQPVKVAAAATADERYTGRGGTGLSKVAVTVHDRSRTAGAGVNGMMFSLTRADGAASTAQAAVTVDYTAFADAYGGDWASRLRLVRLPECALVTPDDAACRATTAVPTTNDARTGTLTAQVSLSGTSATLLAAEAEATGDNGDYTATDLASSGAWQVSQQSGDFSYTYSVRVPPPLGGPAPGISLAYSAGSIDGRTGTSNNQGGWVGDGWSSWSGFIERKYASCNDDNPGHKTGDQCWFNDNATLSMNGHAGELIQDGAVWRLKSDDGTKVERVAGDGSRANGDNDNEYWRVTTTDGTKYYFGYHRLPGWVSGRTETNSVWTVPVYGNNGGANPEPCYNATFANARCNQAWRWNLDYVVDPHDNTMAYYYRTELGAYGRDNNVNQRTDYVRGGYIDHVDYGMRAGTEYSQAAPLRVNYATAERCLSSCWSGAAWTSTATVANWKDTPWDLACPATPCKSTQTAPSFWSARRLTGITTQIRNGTSSYADVDVYTLRQDFPSAGNNEGSPMFLRGIKHSGAVTWAGGAAAADPEVVFDPGAEALPNRVDGPADNRTALNRWRIKAITSESGGQTIVTYSPVADCVRGALPNVETNTTRCMPSYYASPNTGNPTLDWFHKYVVERVDLDDLATDQPNESYFYDYLDAAAWHYTEDEMTKDKYKTWGEWRGYGRVRVRHGTSNGPQTAVEYRYLRGMDGDHLSSGTRHVTVTDSWGGTIVDHPALQGFALQEITTDGVGGAEVSSTRNEPWTRGPTATRTRNSVVTNAYMVKTAGTRTRVALSNGASRTRKTATAFNTDGLPVTADDFGDEAVTGDETCTRTTYARNATTWMIDKVSQEELTSGTCAAAVTQASVLRRTRTFYDTYVDGGSFGLAPTSGNKVRIEELDHWTGGTPYYQATSRGMLYDDNGRPTSVTDARGFTTTTGYTTANGGLVTETVVTNPLGHKTTTTKEPAWADKDTKILDANQVATELAYDGLGRLAAVWSPGRARSATPTGRFTYTVRTPTAPASVKTETLLPSGAAYATTISIYDGFLRKRQQQTQAPGGGRTLADTMYNAMGKTAWTSEPYYDSTNAAPSPALGIPQGQIPSLVEHAYDGAGRETAAVLKSGGQELWRTTTTYSGDRTNVIPPSGGIATTTIMDIRNQTVALRQYPNPADVGSDVASTFTATRYTWDLSGHQIGITDSAGNTWTNEFDLRGRQYITKDPDKGEVHQTYDEDDNVIGMTDANSNVLAFTYDAIGRKRTVRDTSVTGTVRAEWQYDTLPNGLGHLSKAVRYTGGATYESRVDAYDVYGRATGSSVVVPSSEGALCASTVTTSCVYSSAVTYKANGAIATTTYPQAANLASEKLTFGYNDVGALTTMLSPSQIYVYSASYNKLGQLTQRQLGAFGSRVTATSTYDEPTRRLTGTSVVPEQQPEAANYGYFYDAAGNVTSISDTPATGARDTQCFTNDAQRRLVAAWTPASGDCHPQPTLGALGGAAPYWHEWTYDPTGNRLKETRHATAGDTTYASPAPASGPGVVRPHAVTNITAAGPGVSWSHAFSYDNAGNTTARVSDTGNTQTLRWDEEGRLASVTESGKDTSYIYDADGVRLIRKDPTGKTLYLPDGTEIAVPAGSSTATATRYYKHDDCTVAMRTGAALTWLVADHQNTTTLSVKATDLSTSKRRTLPFGQDRGTTAGWPATMSKGFVGGTKDGTGLTHLGAREYDPATGRFMSVDPVIDPHDPQQLHAYAYSANSPVTASDPTGTWCLLCGINNKLKKAIEGIIDTVRKSRDPKYRCGNASPDTCAKKLGLKIDVLPPAADCTNGTFPCVPISEVDDLEMHMLINLVNWLAKSGGKVNMYGGRLTNDDTSMRYENAWCQHMGSLRCGLAVGIEKQWSKAADERYPNRETDETERNAWNAYHHSMWMANMVRSGQFSPEEALTLGLAHELDPRDAGNPYQGYQSRVDMYNNWVGTKLGERALHDNVQAEVYVLQAMQPDCATTVGLCLNTHGR